MKEYRCKFCHRLLCKLKDDAIGIAVEELLPGSFVTIGNKIEIKCSKCDKINEFPIGIRMTTKQELQLAKESTKGFVIK